ncbi:MAG: peptidoglycan DD-metalloendopeptidase family protein [Methylococcales bacterium]|nr:peptidoglycan DD-metalloendopeptidase family protein [Methylococcaceae bacterium]
MKNKIYLPMLIGISLVLSTTIGHAKPAAHQSSKKHTTASVKQVKNKKDITASKKGSSKPQKVLHASVKNKHQNIKPHTVLAVAKKPIHIAASSKKHLELDLSLFHEETIEPSYPVLEAPKPKVIIESTATTEASGHLAQAHGIINSSLSVAGQEAGLSEELIMQLTSIFAWDIDFATNLHVGDQFTVVYNDGGHGDQASAGQIVAAEFVNQGRVYTAIKYQDGDGNVNYYSPEGRPMRKAFLSAPVDFAKISSGFDAHRKHPILNRIRAHKGVDYAARTGTPVKSTGDGEIIFLGNKGAYGQVMIIAHGEHYETLYAHLSDFKDDLHVGDKVTQGQVVAFVGQTGLATGPHLHYEFRIDGVHRNPEKLELAQASPLDDDLLEAFKTQTKPLVSQLYKAKAQNMLVKNQSRFN